MHIQLTKDRPISCRVSSTVLQSLLARSLLTVTGAKLLSSHCRNLNLDKLNPNADRMRKEKGQANKRCDCKNESGMFRSEFVRLTLYSLVFCFIFLFLPALPSSPELFSSIITVLSYQIVLLMNTNNPGISLLQTHFSIQIMVCCVTADYGR